MSQTTFINLRTLSLAFVMGAMLMVGTMTPVHQAAAQEVSIEQRAAMLAQIDQLMQLVAKLMAQLQEVQKGSTAPNTMESNPTTVNSDQLPNDTSKLVNEFSCGRKDSVRSGQIGCYGMIDYDDGFGGHSYVCSSFEEASCQTKIPACVTGVGEVSAYYSQKELSNASTRVVNSIAKNMNITPTAVREEIDGLWEYKCIQHDKEQLISEEKRNTVIVDKTKATEDDRESQATFSFDLEVTAGESDLWIKNSPYVFSAKHTPVNVAKYKFHPTVTIMKDGKKTNGFGDGILSHSWSNVTSSGPQLYELVGEKNDNFHVIKSKQSEKISISLTIGVKESGSYSIKLDSPLVFSTPNGDTVELPIEGDLETESISIRSSQFSQVKESWQLASTQTTDKTEHELEKQELLLELIHTLQETIIKYVRQLTIEQGQTPGENLINQNSVAYTNKDVRLFEKPDYTAKSISQKKNQLGEVIQGPRLINGEVWWEFEFRDGKIGWSPEQYFTREPSVTISYDENKDGIHDFKVRFIGEYNIDQFYLEQGEDGTYIRYRGDSGVEPFSVTEL